MIKSYKDLIVWNKGIELVEEVYKFTKDLPKEELYGLTSQIRRSAISIPSNIAEGQQRKNTKEFLQFLRIAFGSAGELETQLLISKKLYSKIDISKSVGILEEIRKIIITIIKKLEDSNH